MTSPDPGAWEPWTPQEAANELAGLQLPWHVAGGWALDLWHSRQTRPHADLEIATTRADFAVLRTRLARFRFFVARAGVLEELRPEQPQDESSHQHWMLDEAAGRWRMDVMVEPGDTEWWLFRRDRRVRARRSEAVAASSEGIPYLRPQVVLLFKAKRPRPKDEADFAHFAPLMDAADRDWLRLALQLVHPDHPWLDALR